MFSGSGSSGLYFVAYIVYVVFSVLFSKSSYLVSSLSFPSVRSLASCSPFLSPNPLDLFILFPSSCLAVVLGGQNMLGRLLADGHGGEAEPDARDGAGRRVHDPRGPSGRGGGVRDDQRRSVIRPEGRVTAALLRHH